MRVDCFRDGQFLLERGNAQKRQLQHGDGRVFVAVITGAKLRHLKRADRDAVQIFAVFRKPAVGDIEDKIAAGFGGDEFGEFFDMLGESAPFAPQRDIPFDGGGGRRSGE